ncbi:MAG TPA: respiratory nitrate reductase subunit gamma [Terriglobia bacterium]|nr:respiratory nitrate reductase subunit gamma [Terriglobia bacterium]
MISTPILFFILHAGGAVFVIACAVRAIRYARLPLHLRWELYPVPHEERKRAAYGGSYFEESDWWTKPQKPHHGGDLAFMIAEILFLKGLWEFKRKMWYRSYPFHLGLYLLIGSMALLLSTAAVSVFVPSLPESGMGTALYCAYTIAGASGAVLALWGAAALLIFRVTDRELRPYTTPGDIFNLSFFLVTMGFLMAGYIFRPEQAPGALAVARSVLTFDTRFSAPAVLEIGMVLGALLAAYIPMTHMAHFIAKYFTYHSIRWDDEPNRVASGLEKRLAAYLTYRPTWAAAHVGGNGVKTWGEIATTNPAQGGRK